MYHRRRAGVKTIAGRVTTGPYGSHRTHRTPPPRPATNTGNKTELSGPQIDLSERPPPLHVPVRHPQLLVQPLQPPVKPLVRLVLPLRTRLVTKEHPAPERPHRVHPAQLPHLKRTPPRPTRRRLRIADLRLPISDCRLGGTGAVGVGFGGTGRGVVPPN